ncbi:MAG: molybdenum cofactor guanylyltransferase, partial [Candidatus Binataceae bacterium]
MNPTSCEPREESRTAIVLVGGRSLRMGQPKAALKFAGRTIFDHVMDELGASFSEILVVAAPPHEKNFAIDGAIDRVRARGTHVALVRDELAFGGPVGALRNGMRTARNETVFAASCDLPLLDGALARALCAMLDGYDAVIPECGGRSHPLHAAYRRRAAADALARMEASGERR